MSLAFMCVKVHLLAGRMRNSSVHIQTYMTKMDYWDQVLHLAFRQKVKHDCEVDRNLHIATGSSVQKAKIIRL